MKLWLHKLEYLVDKIIPYSVALLLVIITIDFFEFNIINNQPKVFIALNSLIVLLFGIDLVFKYIRIRSVGQFLKRYWLEIIAIFPFFLIFRIFEEFGLLLNVWQRVYQVQPIFHEAVNLEKEAERIIDESEDINHISRTRMMTRAIKPLKRFPKLHRSIIYYEMPTGRHHPHDF